MENHRRRHGRGINAPPPTSGARFRAVRSWVPRSFSWAGEDILKVLEGGRHQGICPRH